jgi:ubiquinol-cytochrome c reductase cytochrome b subunit
VVSFIALGYLGLMPATALYTRLAQMFSVTYFAFFLLMPFYTSWEKTRPVPTRVTS